MDWLWLFIGGGVGACARFAVAEAVLLGAGAGFPWGTLAVNWLGCLLIGAIVSAAGAHPVSTHLRLFLVTGVLGGFTTFSAFGLETHELLAEGRAGAAFGYAGASLVGGLAAVGLGAALGRAL